MPNLSVEEKLHHAHNFFIQTQSSLDSSPKEVEESIKQLEDIINLINQDPAAKNKNHEKLAIFQQEIENAKEALSEEIPEIVLYAENNNLPANRANNQIHSYNKIKNPVDNNIFIPTPLEYAYFCFLTYQDLSSQQDTPLIGWKFLDRVRVTDGFEAGVFQQELDMPQEETGHIVIAFKGYLPHDAHHNIGQLIETIELFFKADKLSRYLEHGSRLYEEIRQNFPTSTISFTGHGLGAVLAEILAVHNDRNAVTFDSLGSKPLMKSLHFQRFDRAKELVTSYFSYPNLLNTLNEQIAAQRFLLHIPRKEVKLESPWGQHLLRQLLLISAPVVGGIFNFAVDVLDHVKEIWKLTLYQHDIRHHLLAFDARTHQPRHYIKIHAWPSFQGQLIGDIAAHLWQHIFQLNDQPMNEIRVAFDGQLLEWRAGGDAFSFVNGTKIKSTNQSPFALAGWASLLVAIAYSAPQSPHRLLSTLIFLPTGYWAHTVSQTEELKFIEKAKRAQLESEQLKIAVAENAENNQSLLNLPSWNNYQYNSTSFWRHALDKPAITRQTRNTIQGISLFLISAVLMGIEFNGNIIREEKTNYYLQIMLIGTVVCFGIKTFLPLDKLETTYSNWKNARHKWNKDPESMDVRSYFDNYKRI